MKKFSLFLVILLFALSLFAKDDTIYLIVRGDDIGSSHAANVACIESYKNGIMRSVEIMVPCPWFPEAVKMLQENPGLDVGVHVTTTAEWSLYKWGPLSCVSTFVDSNGYFYPNQKDWSNADGPGFWSSRTDIREVEQEARAQIELAMKHLPNQVSHISGHMGVLSSGIAPELGELSQRLAKEYDLDIPLGEYGLKRARWEADSKASFEEREAALIKMLNELDAGLYLTVEHPGLDVPEMQATGHAGYEHVATHRDAVTRAFTSEKVKQVIKKRGIKLISYAEAKEIFGGK